MSFRQGSAALVTQGVSLPANFDAITMALSSGDTVETWSYRHGGVSGTVLAQWVITYTSNTRATIVSAVYTDLSS